MRADATSFLLMLLVVASANFLVQFQAISNGVDFRAALSGATVDDARAQYVAQFIAKTESLLQRDIRPDDSMHERHKLRWAFKAVETKLYIWAQNTVGTKAALYLIMLHYAAWATIGFMFIAAALRQIWPEIGIGNLALAALANTAFLAFVMLSGIAEFFSIIETALIAAGLYFSLRRAFLPFLAVLVVAVANRETGIALAAVYWLFNRDSRLALLPFAIAPGVLVLLNADFLSDPDFYRPETYVGIHVDRPTPFTFHQHPPSQVAGALLEIFVILSPLYFVRRQMWRDRVMGPLGLCVALYLLILLLGTYLGNIFPYMMLAPFLIAIVARQAALRDGGR